MGVIPLMASTGGSKNWTNYYCRNRICCRRHRNTCDTTSGTGEDAKFIVKAVNSGGVTGPGSSMPNNCRGTKFVATETAAQATNAVETGAGTIGSTSSGEGFIFTVQAVTAGTTADGGRIGTG